MWNRREMMNRIRECHCQGVPITNYGLVIAYSLGILERALEPFPEALVAYKEERQKYAGSRSLRATKQHDEVGMRLVSQA